MSPILTDSGTMMSWISENKRTNHGVVAADKDLMSIIDLISVIQLRVPFRLFHILSVSYFV